MQVGAAIFDLVCAAGADVTFVVGTGKNVGKTVTARALYEAAYRRGLRVGIMSVGRDGEALDAIGAHRKPRLFLHPGTTLATAREALARPPASIVLAGSSLATAAGSLAYAAVATGAEYELIGPPTASGVREAVAFLRARCDATFVDGAVDRVAAIAGGSGAVVIAVGASSGASMPEAVDAVRALTRRLLVERFDPGEPAIRVVGALTATRAAGLIAAQETRQVVVGDPTQIALGGKAALNAFARLRIRCERPVRPIAITVASIGPERSFEPRAFARAVADAVALPTFDVYAGVRAA
ncbi:MAG TPA: DUF1611 domain-containing protein [Candidatus Tumulicola sp.]|jgi:hypothetical protein